MKVSKFTVLSRVNALNAAIRICDAAIKEYTAIGTDLEQIEGTEKFREHATMWMERRDAAIAKRNALEVASVSAETIQTAKTLTAAISASGMTVDAVLAMLAKQTTKK